MKVAAAATFSSGLFIASIVRQWSTHGSNRIATPSTSLHVSSGHPSIPRRRSTRRERCTPSSLQTHRTTTNAQRAPCARFRQSRRTSSPVATESMMTVWPRPAASRAKVVITSCEIQNESWSRPTPRRQSAASMTSFDNSTAANSTASASASVDLPEPGSPLTTITTGRAMGADCPVWRCSATACRAGVPRVWAYGFGFAWLRIASSGDGGRGSGLSGKEPT